MNANALIQIGVFVGVLVLLVKPLGTYMTRVYEGKPLFGLDRAVGGFERLTYRLGGIRPTDEMSWRTYAAAMLIFTLLGVLAVYLLQRMQGMLPLNPQSLGAVAPDLSFNTAVSFAT